MLEGLVEGIPREGLVVRPIDYQLDLPSYLVWKPFQLRTRACEAFLERMKAEYEAYRRMGGALSERAVSPRRA